MAKYGTTEMLRGGITKEEIAEIRRTLQLGDIVRYRMVIIVKSKNDYRYVEHKVEAEVVAKYPHVVEVVPIGEERGLPIRTVTYTEIAMDRRKQENKKYYGAKRL